MSKLVRKDDPSIEVVATKEIVWATCAFHDVDENGELEYSGWTEIDWDSQQTVKREGQRVFIDENGDELLESEVTRAD